jgi:hypothetical protein
MLACLAALITAGVQPRQIGIIITNSSLFNTTPSLSATIMNHFKMSSKTLNYNLAGMGCSAGVIAIDLARQMLQLYPDSYALVVSTENLTYNWYPGTNKGMLMTNTLFRVGGAAVLLSNKRREAWWVNALCHQHALHVAQLSFSVNELRLHGSNHMITAVTAVLIPLARHIAAPPLLAGGPSTRCATWCAPTWLPTMPHTAACLRPRTTAACAA